MAESMLSSDGSGVEKKSSGRKDEMVMLYVMNSTLFQTLPGLAGGVRLTAAAEDVIRTENLLKGRGVVAHDAKSVSERL